MPPSKDEVQLCALLVDEAYGELASRIINILLRRGRLPLPALRTHTHLTPHQLRLGLAVLVHQNLIYYNTDVDFNITYYEAKPEAAYALVRSGKILQLIKPRFGEVGTGLMQKLLLLGHTKVSDLVKPGLETSDSHANGHSGINGVNGNKEYILPEVSGSLHDLLAAGFIQQVKESMFRSPADTEAQTEKEILRSTYNGSTRGTKQKDELREKVRRHLRNIRDEGLDWQPIGSKRKAGREGKDGLNGNPKRRRTVNGAVGGDTGMIEKSSRLDQDMIVRVNHEKCIVALRSQRLIEFARDRIGETTSRVYGEVLKLLEAKLLRCRSDPLIDDADEAADGPFVSTLELDAAMSPEINVATGIGKAKNGQIDISKVDRTQKTRKRLIDEAEVDGDASSDESDEDEEEVYVNGRGDRMAIDDDDDDDDPFIDRPPRKEPKRAVTFQDRLPLVDTSIHHENRLKQLKNHLLLLTGDQCHLLRKCGSRGLGEWTVDFEPLMAKVRESELDRTIFDNYGNSALRLVRLLKRYGKLEEKQLPNLALMKSKDIRTKMVELHHAGMVDIQEIPKDTAHAVNRTIFLWHFDEERVSQILLMRNYKAMLRCFQRFDVEKREAAEVLDLTERTDVKSMGEEAVMSATQLRKLRTIRGIEQKLLVQIGRLDELVGVFRDY